MFRIFLANIFDSKDIDNEGEYDVSGLMHREVEKTKAWSYSRNCANHPVILTIYIGLR